MMQAVQDYLLQHKFGLAINAQLGAATIFCFILVRVRFSENYEAQYTYYFLIRDLSFAWIPFLLALITHSLSWLFKKPPFLLPFSCVMWSLFFPNAPYLLTDFRHLRLYSGSPTIWFDVILVIWFAFTSLFLGLVSLDLMHRLVQREYGRLVGWIFVVTVSLLSSLGMYIGRFLRFNSWDIIVNPWRLANDLLQQAALRIRAPRHLFPSILCSSSLCTSQLISLGVSYARTAKSNYAVAGPRRTIFVAKSRDPLHF